MTLLGIDKTLLSSWLTKALGSQADRGDMRIRRAGLSGITSVMAQGLAMAANLISIPLTVRYLGAERYGVWLTMGSAVGWLAITDLGFGGNALINVLAEADGKGDRSTAQGLVATAFWCLTMIALAVGIVFGCVFPFVSWTSVFNVSSGVAAEELRQALILQTVIFLVMFPLGVVNATYRAFQEGYIANFWEIVASIMTLLAIVVVTRMRGGLPQLVAALSGTRLIVTVLNAVYLFKNRHPSLMPCPGGVRRPLFARLTSLGMKYLINQLAVIATFQSQAMIITHVLGPTRVGIFTIAHRLITLPSTLVYMLTHPLLSAYSEAKARGDWDWIWTTVKRYLIGAAVFSVVSVVAISVIAQPLVRVWAGPGMVPSTELVIALAVYTVIISVATPPGILLYGLEQVGSLAVILSAHAVLSMILCIRLAQSMGLVGIAVGMSVSFVAANWVGQTIQLRRIVNRSRRRQLASAATVA
jgi:O-antigen/teichoic acid export membrane protein